MQIIEVWHTSDSYTQYLLDDDGNIIGVMPGGNRGPDYDETGSWGQAGTPVTVGTDTALSDASTLLFNELRRVSASTA